MELFKLSSNDFGKHHLGDVVILTGCKDRLYVTECNLGLDQTLYPDKYYLFFPNILVISGNDDTMKRREGMVLAGLSSHEPHWDTLYNVTNEYTQTELNYYRQLKKISML